jgi:GntR family transcriptional repressor for pyruvate dehydrogenase complex
MSETRHETITDQLTIDILSGRYRAGDRLPSERELAVRFGVNRGAARVATKKLEQLGLADVQPGGARVKPVEESTLEVVGRLLLLTPLPDPALVDQVLTVMNALMTLATREALKRADDAEIDRARGHIARLRDTTLSPEARMETRLDLGRLIMRMSGNLVLTLIARALRLQIFGSASQLHDYIHARSEDQDDHLQRLDAALASRDVDAAVATLTALSDLNRDHILTALQHAHASGNGHRSFAT